MGITTLANLISQSDDSRMFFSLEKVIRRYISMCMLVYMMRLCNICSYYRRSFLLCGRIGTISVPRGARLGAGEITWPQRWYNINVYMWLYCMCFSIYL